MPLETLLDDILNPSSGGGSGDVVGPASSTNNDIAVFDGTTGKLLKDGGATVASLISGTIFDAKGDLITATAADTPVRLAVGTDGQVLTANSEKDEGVEWADAPGLPVLQAFKPADTTRSTDTPTDDPDLSVALLAGKTYQINVGLYVTSGAGGFQCELGGTAVPTAVNGEVTSIGEDLFEKSRLVGGLGEAFFSFLGLLITYTTTVTVNSAGTLTVAWAQAAASGDTVLQRGSFILATQLD